MAPKYSIEIIIITLNIIRGERIQVLSPRLSAMDKRPQINAYHNHAAAYPNRVPE